MGHDSEKTTRIYLSSLDNGAIDRANKKIIGQIKISMEKIVRLNSSLTFQRYYM